jgi:hypothetical protein
VKILFDQGAPAPLRHHLHGHEITTAFQRGWQTLQNGELLSTAETEGFDALVTTDKSLRYQQNLTNRRLAIVVLMTTDWRLIRQHVDYIAQAFTTLAPGAYVELPFPPPQVPTPNPSNSGSGQ